MSIILIFIKSIYFKGIIYKKQNHIIVVRLPMGDTEHLNSYYIKKWSLLFNLINKVLSKCSLYIQGGLNVENTLNTIEHWFWYNEINTIPKHDWLILNLGSPKISQPWTQPHLQIKYLRFILNGGWTTELLKVAQPKLVTLTLFPEKLKTLVFNLLLTRIIFHSSISVFFIGKWGADPLQNFVTIPNNVTGSNSCPKVGSTDIKKR